MCFFQPRLLQAHEGHASRCNELPLPSSGSLVRTDDKQIHENGAIYSDKGVHDWYNKYMIGIDIIVLTMTHLPKANPSLQSVLE